MPWLIPAAIVAAAGIGVAGSAMASSSAAKASQQATDQNAELQREALAVQQANTATSRAVGDAAILKLAEKYGLSVPQAQAAVQGASPGAAGAAAQPGVGSPSPAGQPDWNAYIQADPGIMQEYNKQSPGHLAALGVSTPQEFAQWHYNTVGQYDGHTLPTYAAPEPVVAAQAQAAPAATVDPNAPPPATPTVGAAAIDKDGYYTAPRPTVGPAPIYQAPAFRETAIAPLDVSIGKYEKSPDYEFQLDQGNRNILANASATGGLESGAALKALQKFGQDLALGDYSQWRNYTSGRYDSDRTFTANRDDAANGFNLTNAGRSFDSANSTYQFGTNLAQNIYNTNRDYTTSRYDAGNNALFNLASMGQGATTNYNNALSQSATNTGNGYFANATNQGNSALATGGAINSAASNGANALAFYYGNQGGSGGYTPTKNPGTYAPENYGYG